MSSKDESCACVMASEPVISTGYSSSLDLCSDGILYDALVVSVLCELLVRSVPLLVGDVRELLASEVKCMFDLISSCICFRVWVISDFIPVVDMLDWHDRGKQSSKAPQEAYFDDLIFATIITIVTASKSGA